VAVLAVWRSVEELDFFRGRGGTTSTARALWVPGRAKEWQWLGGSGTVGKRRSVRFEWYQIQGGSGSIGGVAVG
jgi:hypothetical protein